MWPLSSEWLADKDSVVRIFLSMILLEVWNTEKRQSLWAMADCIWFLRSEKYELYVIAYCRLQVGGTMWCVRMSEKSGYVLCRSQLLIVDLFQGNVYPCSPCHLLRLLKEKVAFSELPVNVQGLFTTEALVFTHKTFF